MIEWDIVIYLSPFAIAFAIGLLASLRDPGIRRAVAIIRKDGHIERHMIGHRNYIKENGTWWYKFGATRYAARGPYYTFSYKMVRSFGLRQYMGIQRIYLEGNPTPFQFDPQRQIAALDDTANILAAATETDLPSRLLRPRRMDLGILILVAIVALVIGVMVGGRIQ